MSDSNSQHVLLALAVGISIIAMAWFSKYVLPKPVGYLPAAIPPFLAVIYEGIMSRHKGSKITTTWYWVVAILVATTVVIAAYAI